MLGKGGDHHPPLPWAASAVDEAAGERLACNPSSLRATAIQGSSPVELLSHKSLRTSTNLAQTRLAAVGHTQTCSTEYNHRPRPEAIQTQATAGKSDQNAQGDYEPPAT